MTQVLWKGIGFVLLCIMGAPLTAEPAEKAKTPPYTHYWMSVATQNQTIPGMSEDTSGMGGMVGKMFGMPSSGPRRELFLQVNSPQSSPPEPHATHDIPPGQRMGKTLPLLIPMQEKGERGEGKWEEMEKPKARMLVYWGCGETVREGQPRVLDTEKISAAEFGKAFAALSTHAPSPQYPPSPRKGWVYAEWPNKENRLDVPADSSLQGDHFIHGNYMPDIQFPIDQKHDFMAPVRFTSLRGGLAEAIVFQWAEIPTAIGYFAQAVSYNEKGGETIIWSSSEVPDTGFGLLDYLLTSDVRKFIKEKVVMPPQTTTCTIPRGIFKDAAGGALQFIAYGEDLYVEYPPRPKDPKQPWNPIWSVRVRLKSTGMTPLGMEDGGTRRQRGTTHEKEADEDSSEKAQKPERKPEEKADPLKKLRGIFGF